MKFPFHYQSEAMDCGPACLKMVAEYFGKSFTLDFLKDKCKLTKTGASMLSISKAAEAIGLHCIGAKMKIEQLKDIVQDIPVILHWKESHYVVVYKMPKPKKTGAIHVADPAIGLVRFKEIDFAESWIKKSYKTNGKKGPAKEKNHRQMVGYVLLLEPTDAFYKQPKK